MLNKAFRNNGFVVSVGNGLGSVLFPCPPAGLFLRQQTNASGVNWSGCGNYGYNDTSSASYAYYTDGNCGEYWTLNGTWSLPSGSVLYDTGCCQVIWDGSSYYVDDNCNPCGDADTLTGNTRSVNISEIYWEGCNSSGYFSVSYDIEEEYHDGNCGTYWLPNGSYQATDGDTIYSYNGCCYVYYDGSNYPYYWVDDDCSACPDSGPTSSTRIVDEQTLSWSGCSNSGNYTYAYTVEREYADGMCNTYWSFESSWTAMNGDIIFDNGCCTVTYVDFGQYNVNDNCGNGCTSSGTPTGNTNTSNGQWFNWYGCGSSGSFTYSYETATEYHDGNCSTYWVNGTWNAESGDMIYDNGCCTVTYNGSGGYNENDNCNPPPPDYPPAGTILDSGSGDQTAQIVWGSAIMQTNYQDVIVGSYSFQTVADGMGGSTYESWSSYLPDGTNLFQEPIGLELNLNWAVDVNGSPASGTIAWGQELGNWTLESGNPSRTSTSLVDIITNGYMIYESDSWWNGDANVKVQVIFQSGGGYITNTITF